MTDYEFLAELDIKRLNEEIRRLKEKIRELENEIKETRTRWGMES